jgi:hypothetical protein
MRFTLVLALALTPACTLYFPGGDDDDDCDWGGGDRPSDEGDGAAEAPDGLRNPYTGQCEYFGGGGGGGCDDPCAPCDEPPPDSDGDRAPLPSWGYCESYCAGLDEATCLATSGCRASYIETCSPDQVCDFDSERMFHECWSVDQTGPIQGSCENLDAWACSLHDDCVAVHNDACNAWAAESGAPLVVACLGEFITCRPETPAETGCYSDAECAPEEHCNAAEVCLPPPGCEMGEGDSAGIMECETVCYGWCVPDEEPAACEELIGEAACVDRADCTPIYQGVDCTCTDPTDPATCTCQDWIFQYCSSEGVSLNSSAEGFRALISVTWQASRS